MGNIVLLDDLTINKIAAGEVIERPASVIKEMVENSIDAGAKNINIEIKDGGISLIKIIDDGCGLSEDDMEIAFERHATSKIRQASDLETVTTMGFRGEALASIAAIAKVEMVSKRAEDEIGHRIVIEGGKVLEKTEAACQNGTRITVQSLFYNTPVRYKFLKKDYTEAGYIEDAVTRIALVNRDVALKLINNGRVLVQTNGIDNSKNLIYSIFGKDIANGVTDVDYTYEDIRVTGVVGNSDIARSNRSNQLFFVNNRFVRDKNLTAAAEQAYKNIIPNGKYGFLVLNLEMDTKQVDCNVHPAKLEVRFSDESKVFKAVFHAIKSVLGTLETSSVQEQHPFNIPSLEQVENATISLEESKVTFDKVQNEIKEDNKEKSGLSGLFKKFIKEKDETPEEKDNNMIMEIYNARKVGDNLSKPIESLKEENLKEEKIDEAIEKAIEVATTSIESITEKVTQEIIPSEEVKTVEKVANEEILEKTINLAGTKVSSNTKELDFDVTQALKEATQKIDTTKKIEIQETQIIPTTKKVASQETQIIDTVEVIKEKEKNVSEEIENVERVEIKEEKVENIPIVEPETLESTVPSLEAVEKITSKILEMKMNNLDSTQMIDTNKVREALGEGKNITPEFANTYKETFGLEVNQVRKERKLEELEREKINVSNEFVNAENTSIFENKENYKERINYKFIGIAFEHYIIIEFQNEMYVIDDLAARERIMYEHFEKIYYSNENDTTSLLLPDIVTVTDKQMWMARENIEVFRKVGFDYEEFGDNTLKLTAVPSVCEELNTKKLFLSIIDEMDTVAVNDIEAKANKFLNLVACKSTFRPKFKLDEKEVDNLMQVLLAIENPFATVQDRPTAIKMSRSDIEKKFARRK